MPSLRVLIACGLLLLLAVGLSAQTSAVFSSRVQDIVSRTRFMLGPFRFYPFLKFSYFSWVSNIYGFTRTLSHVSDLVITPSPELTAYLLFQRVLILSFTENPEYNFFLSQSKYRGFTNGYHADASLLLFNRFIVSGQYALNTQHYLGYLELDRVVQATSKGATAQVYYETARGTSVSLDGSFRTLTFEDVLVSGGSLSARLDHREKTGSLTIGYRLWSETKFVLRTSYSEYDFLTVGAGWRTSTSAEVTGGLTFPGNGLLRGAFSLGYKKFSSKTPGTQGFAGLVGNAALQFRVENFGIFDLNINRDNYFSLLSDFLFYINNSVEGRAMIRVVDFLFLRFGAQYSILNYPQQNLSGLPLPGNAATLLKDHYSLAFGGVVIRLSRTLGIGLSYQKWLRNSPVLGQNFNGNLVTVDIVRSF